MIVHEIAHQWYGDTVTPDDWSDLWMNEGMATYLAEGELDRRPQRGVLDRDPARLEPCGAVHARACTARRRDYHPGSFGEGNVYYIPALMWDTIRQRVGDDEFWRLAPRVAAAPTASPARTATTLAAWWSKQSGQDLTPVFHAWLLGAARAHLARRLRRAGRRNHRSKHRAVGGHE